jgi:GDP-mannose 6-dehydrogenase
MLGKVRSSKMVERLVGKGRAIRIFDPNVQLDRLLGTNKEYLVRELPHIAELMVADVIDVVGWAETIVVTTTDPAYATAIAAARSDQIVLDFARLESTCGGDGNVLGFLW